ncbi:hypothetical protein P153DRAFT_189835 [Dothidotthia symphoricarpi CBS 119687]|uniref:Uncharacterized protein n=1 Tax=Dothidotthia symphoricarpi CBS 119687 TaxID=1392245 RepID=A0A6A6ANC3_9PLEO|nr:uncharacterized protein P153DRAFT_189835 [Dothidotthia symphoricarpi CBS 119687]KAF2132387.1 hypothetical protein P153DRAFT_189835 [Dothidotthia symphoricarpi CBS 119687]
MHSPPISHFTSTSHPSRVFTIERTGELRRMHTSRLSPRSLPLADTGTNPTPHTPHPRDHLPFLRARVLGALHGLGVLCGMAAHNAATRGKNRGVAAYTSYTSIIHSKHTRIVHMVTLGKRRISVFFPFPSSLFPFSISSHLIPSYSSPHSSPISIIIIIPAQPTPRRLIRTHETNERKQRRKYHECHAAWVGIVLPFFFWFVCAFFRVLFWSCSVLLFCALRGLPCAVSDRWGLFSGFLGSVGGVMVGFGVERRGGEWL